MEYKFFFDGTKVPVLGLGTFGFGGYEKADYSNDTKDIEIIKKAIEYGYTHIDTAEGYSEGHSEELVGEAISAFDRDKLFLTSKIWETNLEYNSVINSLEGTLKRLKTNYLDLYLIHSYNKNIDIKETISALLFLKKEGKIKNFGVSNFSLDNLKEAQKYTNEIAVNQIQYNYLNNNKEIKELVSYCLENKIIITAYRPLLFGEFEETYKSLSKIAEIYKKTIAQVILRGLVKQEGVITIVKSSNLEHLKENLDIFNFKKI